MVISKKYQEIYTQLLTSIDPSIKIILFAVLKMDEIIDRWSIIISAHGITDENRKSFFSSFVKILSERLNNEELSEIARVGILSPKEHLIHLFLEADIKSGDYIKSDIKINGNIIHEGHIIAVNKAPSDLQDSLNFDQ